VGLVAEANCTWCVAGKYQTGSGVHMPVWRPLVPGTIRRLYCDLQGALGGVERQSLFVQASVRHDQRQHQ
jgi:hypothetical protein